MEKTKKALTFDVTDRILADVEIMPFDDESIALPGKALVATGQKYSSISTKAIRALTIEGGGLHFKVKISDDIFPVTNGNIMESLPEVSSGLYHCDDCIGIIGRDILQYFELTFDGKKKKVTLKANRV